MIRALGILLAGYGVAAGSAIAVYALGYSLFLAILTFWIGGAVAVCIIAVIGTPHWSEETEMGAPESEEPLQRGSSGRATLATFSVAGQPTRRLPASSAHRRDG